MKTARVSPQLGGLSMARVVGAIEDYVFQLESVDFLRSQGQEKAAATLEEKVVHDLGKNIAAIVKDGFGKKGKAKG
ncbi:hypothetical protein [Desulfohalovibrio reitneri]|uniref:hypothetical protein n=1 Tax=Desulfohalovibrio reitneri TaxID=1307759 RepID=UPI00110F2D82|nr:hypothetical protein [Desulfohalovibrio reitneri]